jgi:hypothetical protein
VSSYYAQRDIEVYERQLGEYETALNDWQAEQDRAHAAYDADYARYEQLLADWTPESGEDEPLPPPEPEWPTVPEPAAPGEPFASYTMRVVTTPEQLDTPDGTAIVMPDRLVVSSPNGDVAMSADEFAANFTTTFAKGGV